MRGKLRRTLLVLGTLPLTGACGSNFDEVRRVPERASLGQEIYTVLCDRIGAGALTEDLSGASYRALCHGDSTGAYATTVDESLLPSPDSLADPALRVRALATRRLAVSKLEALARRRVELVEALDATLVDTPLSDPLGKGPPVSGHEALSQLLRALVPLYEDNPIDPAAEPLMPSVTRATARFFAGLGGPGHDDDLYTHAVDAARAEAAQQALAKLSGRAGYRPTRVALGALRPTLAYPGLRSLAQVLTPRLAPGGDWRAAFQDVLGSINSELDTSEQAALPVPWKLADPGRLQPNRPRTTVEVAAAALLSSSPAYAVAGASERFITRRDPRGWAVPAGAILGVSGSLPAPFADTDGDGYADVDGLGRFLDAQGQLASAPSPFVIPGLADAAQRDSFGRALQSDGSVQYQTLNTNSLLVTAIARELVPLIDPEGGNESLVDLLSGAWLMYGEPMKRPASFNSQGYGSFDASRSPIVALLHATGQLLAHPRSDATLALLERLFTEHKPLMARIVKAALKLREVSNAHPEAKLAPENPFWDEFAELAVVLLHKPAVFKDLLRAFQDPRVHTTLSRAFGKFAQYRDIITYDPQDLNGGLLNLSSGDKSPPHLPVDRRQPDTIVGGVDQRSIFHRTLQMIHDMDGVNACNKKGAKLKIKLGGLNLDYPLIGTYDECEVLRIPNIGLVYLDAVLDDVYHRSPRQGVLKIEDGVLNLLVSAIGGLVNMDDAFRQSSGLTGMSLAPTARAFDRLVFFGTTSNKFDGFFGPAGMPDRDPEVSGRNSLTNSFISNLVDPISTSVCPTRTVRGLAIQDCTETPGGDHSPADLLRLRNLGGIFQWEQYDFLTGVAPLAMAFDKHNESQLFLDLLQVLYRHWPSEKHGKECSKKGSWRKDAPDYNPRYCHESGLSRYEPILVELFEGELLPAVGELLTIVDQPSYVTDARGNGAGVNGIDLVTELAVAFMDPDYAASVGMVGLDGKASTTYADGSVKPQLTPMDLFANTLRDMDRRTATDEARRLRWRSARSKLVDAFMETSGSGSSMRFTSSVISEGVPTLLRVLREQLNANCPDREQGGGCEWASKTLAQKTKDTFERPSFGTAVTLVDLLDHEPKAKLELQRFLRHLLHAVLGDDAEAATLTSIVDLLQILDDEENLPPLFNAVSLAAAPRTARLGGEEAPGAADRVVELLNALTRETDESGAAVRNPYDPYHYVDLLLRNLVTPMNPLDANSLAPIEVILDVIAEVNREDASLPRGQPLTPRDFQLVFSTMRDFMSSRTRGFEQIYEIMRHRNGN